MGYGALIGSAAEIWTPGGRLIAAPTFDCAMQRPVMGRNCLQAARPVAVPCGRIIPQSASLTAPFTQGRLWRVLRVWMGLSWIIYMLCYDT